MTRHIGRSLAALVWISAFGACESPEASHDHAEHTGDHAAHDHEAHEQAAQPAAQAAQPLKNDAPSEAAGGLPAIPEGAKIQFVEPTDGATVEGPLADGAVQVSVKMGAEGIAVKPAGMVEAGSGHHHLLIDHEPVPAGQVVPKDDTHMHFGAGQTEATVGLAPGEHRLVLQFADGIHRSYGPELSASIKVTVAAAQGASR